MTSSILILGGGMTGIAAGLASGFPVYEAEETAGGICSSYYVRSTSGEKLHNPKHRDEYRFEIGGGHWIWDGDPLVLHLIQSIASTKLHMRESAVYFRDKDLLVPYPIQDNLRYLGPQIAAQVLAEMIHCENTPAWTTMAEWFRVHFGPTLCRLFFEPFHELFTANLWESISPQDDHKSPVDLRRVTRGTSEETAVSGYNATFVYPAEGLGTLAHCMAARCDIHYRKRVESVDVNDKTVHFEDGEVVPYDLLISTLPLNQMIELTRLSVGEKPCPYTSVLVTNIGGIKGQRCPKEHWVYVPKSRTKFHRVGFYSNVDTTFLPLFSRRSHDRVGLYVEKAYAGGQKPCKADVAILCRDIVSELREWGWIEDAEVIDPTWVNVAYSWIWPDSRWTQKAVEALETNDIFQVGRFARWANSQGIAQSIRDGLLAGAILKSVA